MHHPTYGQLGAVMWIVIGVLGGFALLLMLGSLVGKCIKVGMRGTEETCVDRSFACCDGEMDPAPANCLLYGARFVDAA